MTEPVLAVSDLATHFFTDAGLARAVDGVSLTLGRGEVLGLVGESGSGKSVTGFSLIGLVDPPGRIVRGSIRLNGVELTDLSHAALRKLRGRRIAMIFQDPMMTLNPVLTIARQMGLALRAHGRISKAAARARCIEVLETVGIPAAKDRIDDYPHQFSGGMRQRVAIAMALLHRPDVILADEATTALDVSIQAQILAEIRRLVRDTGTSFIWVSHDIATVSMVADRIAVMYGGRIVEEGPSRALLRNPRHPYTRGLLDALPSQAEPGTDLAQIDGVAPSLVDLPEGCVFAPRCKRRSAMCDAEPGMTTSDSRAWRCHHPLEPGQVT